MYRCNHTYVCIFYVYYHQKSEKAGEKSTQMAMKKNIDNIENNDDT